MGFRDYSFKKVLKKNLSYLSLKEAIENNLRSLDKILDYNIENDLRLFRISSDLIPFGDLALEYIDWPYEFREEFRLLGQKARDNSLRLSFHPGQYTVLNSKDPGIVENSIRELAYQTRVLDLMGLDYSNKVNIHVGGVYGDKAQAIERFIENYNSLDKNIRARLTIENDERSYSVGDLILISERTGVPLVFDNLHNELLDSGLEVVDILSQFSKTWKEKDGRQIIHYSQEDRTKRRGAHSRTIDLVQFRDFYEKLRQPVDIILEVKDKDLSTIKVNNLLYRDHVKYLEFQWAKYKYNILERDPKTYQEIRNLLKDRESYRVIEFYSLIDWGMDQAIEKNRFINGADHVFGYFKELMSESEKKKRSSYMERYLRGSLTERAIKKFLLELAEKYEIRYLLDSYYFDI